MHGPGLKFDRKNADRVCMAHQQTSVIDAQPTDGPTTSPPAVRRTWLALAAGVVVVAAGSVVWITAGGDAASADRPAAGKAMPSASTAAPSDAVPSGSAAPTETVAGSPATSAGAARSSAVAPSAAAPAPPAAPAAGWESRTFQGVTFSVPPGAQAPDALDPGNADVPPSFIWTGPTISDGMTAQITVRIYPADQAPVLGTEYQSVTVPGAEQAHVRTGTTGTQPPLTAVDVHVLSAGRFINLIGMFPTGAAGEQMARDLLASLSIG